MRQFNSINPLERVIAAASYLTACMAGFIWWIIAILIKKNVKQFLIYHIMQSIFISIAYFIFVQLYQLIFVIVAKIPIINAFMFFINTIINNPLPLFMGLSLIQVLTTTVMFYLAITSFMGMYTYIPWVSDIININSGRK